MKQLQEKAVADRMMDEKNRRNAGDADIPPILSDDGVLRRQSEEGMVVLEDLRFGFGAGSEVVG